MCRKHCPGTSTDQTQLGGVTLTYSVLYLTIYLHKANRNVQHTILQQSNGLLNLVVEPPEPIPDPPAYEIRRAGLSEQLKDRWNDEIEKMVHKVQTTDWTEQREIYEQKIATAWSTLRQTEQAQQLASKAKEAADSARSKAQEVAEDARTTARDFTDKSKDTARDLANTGAEEVKEKLGVARDVAQERLGAARDVAQEKLGVARDVAQERLGAARDVAKEKLGVAQDIAKQQTGQKRLLDL